MAGCPSKTLDVNYNIINWHSHSR